MSTDQLATPEGAVRAMCLGCGTLRTTRAAIGCGSRSLRCSVCGRATEHCAADRPARGRDYREEANHKGSKATAAALAESDRLDRHEGFLRDLFAMLGVDIRVKPWLAPGGKPSIYTVDRWIMPGSDRTVWRVTLLEHLTAAGRVWALTQAWKDLTPDNIGGWADAGAYSPARDGSLHTGMFRPTGSSCQRSLKTDPLRVSES